MNNGVDEIFEGNGTKPESCYDKGHWLLVVFSCLTICVVMYLGLSNLSLGPFYIWMFSVLCATALGWSVHMILRNKRLDGCLIFHIILYLVCTIYVVSTDIDCWKVWQ